MLEVPQISPTRMRLVADEAASAMEDEVRPRDPRRRRGMSGDSHLDTGDNSPLKAHDIICHRAVTRADEYNRRQNSPTALRVNYSGVILVNFYVSRYDAESPRL